MSAREDDVLRRFWVGQHAMKGSVKGVTLKKSFSEATTAEAEAVALNAQETDPAQFVIAYPCLWTDGREWGGLIHWHLGRDRALRLGGQSGKSVKSCPEGSKS